MTLKEISALMDLTNELTSEEIIRIKNEIDIPEGLCEDITQKSKFINAMKQWKGRDPHKFYLALQHIRPDLLAVACDVKLLCASSPVENEYQDEELSMKTLINLLRDEIPKDKWLLIYIAVTDESIENISFEMAINKLLENGFIQKDLRDLTNILIGIQRNDLVVQLKVYINLFSQMQDGEFESKFKREIGMQEKEMKRWETNLKLFSLIQHGKVKEMLGSQKYSTLTDVYIDLTILKEEPKQINLEDETTYNEIAMLRRIARQGGWRKTVDFTEELVTYERTKPEIWCIIGNPGCGKTFLAMRTALRFSSSELVGIQFSISIPCRNTVWHSMEAARYEVESKIDSEFKQKWLVLGLPIGSSWSNDLAKHLNQSDGEGLLLIIDGLDEFTKRVPFKDTFLCLLLKRQTLIRSTIIITSRPGAWTVISSTQELKIDRYYQVLGFSPKNRDLYFRKQISDEKKLNECRSLMNRHDEIKQLSLIPVNASLFAALMKGEESTSINTLTKLYYELALYMIRRELSRMGLKEYSRVSRISNLHEDILACLYRIGFIAFLGVANRDLASEENVTLSLGQEEYPCQCLGLAHEHYRKESIGLMKQVWTFVHLTMQEFVSALYLEHTTWTEQCYSVRYISHSEANFSLFRMVVRFLCGLLSDRAAALLSIIYRYLTPQPIQLIDLPMSYQFVYSDLYHHKGWNIFSDIHLQLAAIMFETDSESIPLWFNNFKQYFPTPVYLYIRDLRVAVTPNEWICFIQSIKLVGRINFIHIDTSHINPTQFHSFIQEMKICSVNLLALRFIGKDSTTVQSYTNTIRNTGMKFDTKISIELSFCNFRYQTSLNLFPEPTNRIIASLKLFVNKYSNKAFQELSNQFSTIQYLYFEESGINCDSLVPALCQATQLRVLHLYDIPSKHIPSLAAVLPRFSQLQEIGFMNSSLLPAISHLLNLTYLQLGPNTTRDTTLCNYLLHIINGNKHSLRGMVLWYLHRIGLNNWSLLFNCLEFCANSVKLVLRNTALPSNDVTHWSRAVNKMKLLVKLELWNISLYDTGLLSLCEGLIYHHAIRSLVLILCRLTSLSCDPLTHLIPTTSQLEILRVDGLSKPDIDPILLLEETADEFGIELKLD